MEIFKNFILSINSTIGVFVVTKVITLIFRYIEVNYIENEPVDNFAEEGLAGDDGGIDYFTSHENHH